MIIYFGGSFNPVTLGHIKIILKVKALYPDSEVFLMPCGDHYNFYKNKVLISAKHRIKMLKLVLKDYPHLFKISLHEVKQKAFFGTFQSLRDLNHPCFLIGADSLDTLSDWKENDALLRENTFLVVNREGFSLEKILETKLNKYKDHFKIINVSDCFESSSLFRKTRDEALVTKNVYQYILKNRLYE